MTGSGKNKNTILTIESESALRFGHAIRAYKDGVRFIQIESPEGRTAKIRDIRVFLFNRAVLIAWNLAFGKLHRIWNAVTRASAHAVDQLELHMHRIKQPYLKKYPVAYFEYRFRRHLGNFLAGIQMPMLKDDVFDKQRVQFFIGSLGPGGAERQLVTTVLNLGPGHDVCVTCEHYETPTERHFGYLLDNAGIPVNRLERPDKALEILMNDNHPGLQMLLANDFFTAEPNFAETLLPYILSIQQNRPGVVHAWLDYVNIRAGLAALIMGVPRIILSLRSVAPDNFSLFTIEMHPIYKFLFDSGRVVVINNSERGKYDYCRWLNVRPDLIRVIYNGISFDPNTGPDSESVPFRGRYDIPEHAPLVGGIIRFSEEKRPFLWLEHARTVLAQLPDAWFVLAGHGPMFDEAVTFAHNLGIAHRVRFTGLIEDAAEALRAMDVFVLSSRMEGLPNVLIEAQLMGVPVVTTDVGGASETLQEGVTGFTVSDATHANLAKKVIRVLQDRHWREQAALAGPAFVQQRFNPEGMAGEIKLLYRQS